MAVSRSAPKRWICNRADFGSPTAPDDAPFREARNADTRAGLAAAKTQHKYARRWRQAATRLWQESDPSRSASVPPAKWIAAQIPGLSYVEVKEVLAGDRRLNVRHIVGFEEVFGEQSTLR